MLGELIINGKDAYATWGVSMGNGFLDAIDAPLPMKDYIENESRLEHGKRVITVNPKVASREITLTFTIKGADPGDYRAKKKAFETELRKGAVTIRIPPLDNDVSYHLMYLGKNIAYGLSATRCFSNFSSKFSEPNPMDRG